jgi:hypothetical protein
MHVKFLLDRVALGQTFSRALLTVPAGIIPPLIQTHLHINTILIRRTSGQSLGGFEQGNAFCHIGEHRTKIYLYYLLFKGLSSSI